MTEKELYKVVEKSLFVCHFTFMYLNQNSASCNISPSDELKIMVDVQNIIKYPWDGSSTHCYAHVRVMAVHPLNSSVKGSRVKR